MRFDEHNFSSRRSVVMSRRGMAASSQPLAVEAAIRVLRSGGNAVDAAVTATAVLGVVEPMATGLGGDCFALIYSAKEKRLFGLNASGRAPEQASAESLIAEGHTRMPVEGPLSVTVPGALDGLAHCLARFGTLSLREALEPAVACAQDGFPVTEITAQFWKRAAPKLSRYPESARVYLPHGEAMRPGEIFKNPDLARTLRSIAEGGPELFYRGALARQIAAEVRALGGLMTPEDLAAHTTEWIDPISTSYRGREVVEMPPNNQGLAALVALNIVEGYELAGMHCDSPAFLHYLIEAMKLALVDARTHVADPGETVPLAQLLSKKHAAGLRAKIDPGRAQDLKSKPPGEAGDTVFVAVVDEERNAVSMISSLFKAFGSGITVPGTGMLLQNRGAGFVLESGHANRLGPGKRPFHTIMPGMIMHQARPWACFGVVGGMMQAQGHLQVACNLIDFEMNPQSALDAPRFRILEDGHVSLEKGISEAVRKSLSELGHDLADDETEEGFGGGQVILIENETLFGGSDCRKDGCALGY